MGGANSCLPSSIESFHTLRRRHHLFTKVKYNQSESTHPKNTIKLNHASEDELLLLPGINRSIAQNILQYRQLNQGFRQIDELLLVNGINRELFERIQSDISIDIPSQSTTKQDLININLATYEQLCSIPNLSPILAKRIIKRRQRKGSFRFIEDLLNIRGIDYIILANIRSYITINSHQITSSVSQSSIPTLYPTLNKNNNNQTIPSDSLSIASLLLETLPPELQTILLSSHPQRPSPIVKTKQTYVRFASWNLQQLTNEKVQNPGVREVICRIILENK
jgi:DNA uptake protein ComE-like DNA-binding protein